MALGQAAADADGPVGQGVAESLGVELVADRYAHESDADVLVDAPVRRRGFEQANLAHAGRDGLEIGVIDDRRRGGFQGHGKEPVRLADAQRERVARGGVLGFIKVDRVGFGLSGQARQAGDRRLAAGYAVTHFPALRPGDGAVLGGLRLGLGCALGLGSGERGQRCQESGHREGGHRAARGQDSARGERFRGCVHIGAVHFNILLGVSPVAAGVRRHRGAQRPSPVMREARSGVRSALAALSSGTGRDQK